MCSICSHVKYRYEHFSFLRNQIILRKIVPWGAPAPHHPHPYKTNPLTLITVTNPKISITVTNPKISITVTNPKISVTMTILLLFTSIHTITLSYICLLDRRRYDLHTAGSGIYIVVIIIIGSGRTRTAPR